jgi:hypothetical protein
VAWSPSPATTFEVDTVYTTIIIKSAKDGYTPTGLANNFFTVEGSTSVSTEYLAASTAVIEAEFPETVSFTAFVAPTSKTYIAATAGYTAKRFTIINTGTGNLANVQASLGIGADFVISAALSAAEINAGGAATVSVRLKTGLALGTHTDTLTITGDNALFITANVSFTIKTAPSGMYM